MIDLIIDNQARGSFAHLGKNGGAKRLMNAKMIDGDWVHMNRKMTEIKNKSG